MKKSKRQRQTDLLEKLLERVNVSQGITSMGVVRENIDWINKKMSQVAGGDIDLDSGGLSKQDMLQANNMWTRYSVQESLFTSDKRKRQ